MNEIHLPKTKVAELHAICAERNNDPGELINILHAAQGLFGYLPPEVQQVIAAELNIPVSRVYGVVTFYSFFTMTPKGKYPISVCLGTACYVRGAENVLEEMQRQLEIKVYRIGDEHRTVCSPWIAYAVSVLADWLRWS